MTDLKAALEKVKQEKANEIPKLRCDMAYKTGFDSATELLLPVIEEVEATGTQLLKRIDANGGIGEYKGGPAFVVEPFRDALEKLNGVGK